MKNVTKIDINKMHSIKSYAEVNKVSRTLVDRWIQNGCINSKTGQKFKFIEHRYLKLIIEVGS